MDIYDEEIAKLVKLNFVELDRIWFISGRFQKEGEGIKLFSSCGIEKQNPKVGCPTQIRNMHWIEAATPELTELIRNMADVPKFLSEIREEWDKGTESERALLLQGFARAHRETDKVLGV